jgi:hypothetical protein
MYKDHALRAIQKLNALAINFVKNWRKEKQIDS